MSELQIGLLAIGTLVVAAVLIYNRVQERRAKHEAERAFRSGHHDVLLRQPAVAHRSENATQGAAGGAVEQGREPAQEALRPPMGAAPTEETAQPDPAIDYIIQFAAEHPDHCQQRD